MQTEFDSIIEGADFEKIYSERRNKVFSFMAEHNIGAAVFSDFEEKRDPAVRYLCGHPGDALLVLAEDKTATLVPWDINLAEQKAHADEICAYSDYGRNYANAIKAVLAKHCGDRKTKVCIPPETSHISFLKLSAELPDTQFVCSENYRRNDRYNRRKCAVRKIF